MKGLWSLLSNENNARAIGLLLVGLPVAWAALTYVVEHVWPDPAAVFIIHARDFVRGNNVNTTAPDPCYQDLLLNEPPYNEQPNSVEFRVSSMASASYDLLIEYAALESRPVVIQVNNLPAVANVLAKTTGSWCNTRTRWENVGTFRINRGANVIKISRDNVFPHIKSLKLVLNE